MQTSLIKFGRLTDFLCGALLLSFTLTIAYPRWRAGFDWGDEGFLAYSAVRVMQGEVPHRDFVSLQPPLSFYTVAGIFKLFGTSLASQRVLGLSIFLLLPLLIYGVGRNFTGPIVSCAAAAPACMFGIASYNFVPLAVWQGIAASLVAVLFFLPAVFSRRRWLAFPAGLLTAASLFLRHDQAVYTMMSILALAIALGIARGDSISRADLKQALLFWLAGIGVALIPAIFIWWRLGALPEMFRQLILFPFTTYRKTSARPFPRLFVWRSGWETTLVLLFYLLPLVQAIAAVCLVRSLIRRQLRRRGAILAFLIIWSALFYLQVIIRADIIHLVITLPPFFLLVAFGWSIVHEKVGNHRKLDIAFCAVSTALVAWVLCMPFAFPYVSGQSEQLTLDRGGVLVSPAQAHEIADFVRHVQASVPPDRSILALPYIPMFYFLCERRNPTRWSYLWPGDQTAHDHERLIQEAESDPPALVLLSQQREVAAFAPAIISYVHAHYLWTGDFGDVGIYARKSEPR